MKHFLNSEMLAVNAKAIPVDAAIVAEFADRSRIPGRLISVVPAPGMWKSDIEWISADDEEAFEAFESAFHRLGIPDQAAPYIDVDKEVRLFAGFLVVRSRCTDAYFHTDWRKLNNEAFTVLTPVTDNAREFGLLYKKATGETGEYRYRPGEAIMFGDNFMHSTKPGQSEEPVVLLCFQFGSDKMEHWPAINAQLNTQATQLRLPDGRLVRTGGKADKVLS
jgi:hypothetical protein